MGRSSLYPDRVRLLRFTSRKVRGEVIASSPALPVGDWIPCLYRTPSGTTVAQEARDYLPENAVLIIHHTDSSGFPVQFLGGDKLELQYGTIGTYLAGSPAAGSFDAFAASHIYRIVGQIVKTRAKRTVESFQLEVIRDKEF